MELATAAIDCKKPRFGLEKRRRRLRPRHQVRVCGIGRAEDLATRGGGLRDSRNVGLALLARQTGEFSNMLFPFAGGVPVAILPYIEIGLDQDGRSGAGGLGRR